MLLNMNPILYDKSGNMLRPVQVNDFPKKGVLVSTNGVVKIYLGE